MKMHCASSEALSFPKRLIALFPFRLHIESMFATSLPEQEQIAILTCLRRQFEHGAVKRRAIIIGKIDQTSFLDEAAQFDQVASARSSLHDPSSHICAALSGFSPANRLRQLHVHFGYRP